jgi:signal peptidase I
VPLRGPYQPRNQQENARRAGDFMTSGNDTDKTEAAEDKDKAVLEKIAGIDSKPLTLKDRLWNDTVQTIVYAFAIALVVRVVAFEPFNIPSGSMKPTLLVGDYLFVSKYRYGYSRYSFPFGFPPFSGRIWESPVERGDVAVFRKPPENDLDFIKRIIGLPGDRIQVLDGLLHINGDAVDRERIEDFTDDYGRKVPQYIETLPNGRTHRILESAGDDGNLDNTKEFVVPAGHYFGMGDNRDNSSDSRVFRYIPAENMVGRAEILFFSTDGSAAFWEFWRWPFATRYSRLFDGVE